MTDIVDVDFKETISFAIPAPKIKVTATNPEEGGFPYIIHAPMIVFKTIPEETLRYLGGKGVRAEKSQPIFLRTNVPYSRISIKRGDTATAVGLYNLLSSISPGVYKNWK